MTGGKSCFFESLRLVLSESNAENLFVRNNMNDVKFESTRGDYVLATGDAAAHRLRILHNIYGEGASQLLTRAGIRRGMRVADLGCGVGMVTQLLAQLVGPDGEAIGVDFSGPQIAKPSSYCRRNFQCPLCWKQAQLRPISSQNRFDLVYCRFLLIHLTEPEKALNEMYRLLKPNGILVCEDGDLTSAGSEPYSKLCCSQCSSVNLDCIGVSTTHWVDGSIA